MDSPSSPKDSDNLEEVSAYEEQLNPQMWPFGDNSKLVLCSEDNLLPAGKIFQGVAAAVLYESVYKGEFYPQIPQVREKPKLISPESVYREKWMIINLEGEESLYKEKTVIINQEEEENVGVIIDPAEEDSVYRENLSQQNLQLLDNLRRLPNSILMVILKKATISRDAMNAKPSNVRLITSLDAILEILEPNEVLTHALNRIRQQGEYTLHGKLSRQVNRVKEIFKRPGINCRWSEEAQAENEVIYGSPKNVYLWKAKTVIFAKALYIKFWEEF